MTSIKGFPSADKITSGKVPRQGYVTIQPSDDKRFGLDTINRAINVFSTALPVEAGSTQNVIVSTAHPLEQGDVVRFKTPAALNGKEVAIIEIIDVDSFKLGEFLKTDPTGGTFDAGRYVTPSVDADGALSVGGAVGGQEVAEFNDVLPTILNTEITLLQTDVNGRLINIPQGQFNVATPPALIDLDFSTLQVDSGARLITLNQAQFNLISPTLLDGEFIPIQLNENGLLRVDATGGSTRDVLLTTVFDYAVGGPVDNANFIEIVADTGLAAFTQIDIFDSSGFVVELAIGAVAGETRKLLISPGGNGLIPVVIPANSRLSIRAVTGSPIGSGDLVINYVG